MKLTMQLADYAQTDSDGKVTAVGLGWSVMGTPLQAFTVLILLDLSVEEQEKYSDVTLRLLDGNGKQVSLGGANVSVVAQMVADKGKTADPELPVLVPLCMNVGLGMPLEPGMYSWRAEVGDQSDPSWVRPFKVMDGPLGFAEEL